MACDRLATLSELRGELAQWGVDAADDIVDALATGPEHFAELIACDPGARQRFADSAEALDSGVGNVSPDAVTVGALVWAALERRAFSARVGRILSARTDVVSRKRLAA